MIMKSDRATLFKKKILPPWTLKDYAINPILIRVSYLPLKEVLKSNLKKSMLTITSLQSMMTKV